MTCFLESFFDLYYCLLPFSLYTSSIQYASYSFFNYCGNTLENIIPTTHHFTLQNFHNVYLQNVFRMLYFTTSHSLAIRLNTITHFIYKSCLIFSSAYSIAFLINPSFQPIICPWIFSYSLHSKTYCGCLSGNSSS